MLGATIISYALFIAQTTQTAPTTRPLQSVLAEISRKTEVYAIAVSALANEKVVAPPIDSVTKENVEEKLLALIKKTTIPAMLVRLNLPKGPNWTADEIIAYGNAEAKLLRRPVGRLHKDGIVEILGEQVPKEKAAAVAEALNLRTVYVVLIGAGTFAGTWETTYGTMVLNQNGSHVTGTYTTGGGQIRGEVVNGVLSFVWVEASGSSGFGSFTMSDDGSNFSGPWYTDGDPTSPAGTWTGKRTG